MNNTTQSLARCLTEQKRCASELLNPDSTDKPGARLGLADWTMEEVLIREKRRETIQRYREFLKRKIELSANLGFEIEDSEIHPFLKPHQRVGVKWGVKGGRRALFESFGLGKTVQQLEILRIILKRAGGRGLIVAPFGVRQEFRRDAEKISIQLKFIRSIEECSSTGIYLTNYETVRDGKLDPAAFTVTSLDEAAVLRGFGGTKTFREFMRLFEGVRYRFVATATPDPNEYIELLAYAAYLGIMDVGQAKTRFFKRDSTKADKLTIHPHKEEEFWLWVSSWALFLQKPSDLGFDDAGYALPQMRIVYHEVRANHEVAVSDKDGQMWMFRNSALGVTDAAREKRESMPERILETQRILAEHPDDHFLLWHDLEDERHALEKAIPGIETVFGSQTDLEERERIIIDFSEGRLKYLGGKPSMIGAGCNFQYHCHQAIFCGIGFKFAEFIQAVHRVYRFLQDQVVTIHLIYSESEREVLKILLEKWKRHTDKVEKMSAIIQEYGLSELALAQALTRSIGCERLEISGPGYRIINNDTVEEMFRDTEYETWNGAASEARHATKETHHIEDNSVGLILTSIPFSTQYEYTPSYNDFGHSDSNGQFFEQMDFLTPELMRVLMPGRVAAIHVKDRIVPGGINGYGCQSVYPFHAETISHFVKHGFLYMGMKTIVTDVVRENNQTYRLGWSEQCKDGSKMGYGMPEYLLLFRKPQTDHTKGYADVPVRKDKKRYSRTRWQVDAHGFTRSSGNRQLTPDEIRNLPHEKIFKMFDDFSLKNVYDFEHHVHLGEALEHYSTDRSLCECKPETCKHGRLPVTFMLLQPPSWHPDVWTDITRMITMNALQAKKGKQQHLCPMQFDLADRVIVQMSNEGETVFDPFGGLMSVPYRAIALKRFGLGVELNKAYFLDGAAYCEAAARKMSMPTLFDGIEAGL